MVQLRAAAQAAGADGRAFGQGINTVARRPNQHIAHRSALGHGRQGYARDLFRGKILEAVNGHVDPFVQQGLLDFSGKDVLRSDGFDLRLLIAVTVG